MDSTESAVTRPQRKEIRRRPRLSWERTSVWLFPAVALLLFFSIFPLLYNLYHTFFEFDPLVRSFVPVGFDNWMRIFTEERVRNSMVVTFKYTTILLLAELILGFAIALLFDRDPIGISLWQSILILPMVTPPAVAALIFQLLEHSEFGILSWVLYGLDLIEKSEPLLGGTGKHALTGVMLVDLWQWTPFMAVIILAGLKALPEEPLEAATVDGANALQILWYVIIPLLRPVIAVAVLLRIIDLYRVFDYIYVLTSGGPGTRTEVISYYTYLQSFSFIKWGYGSTLGVVTLVVIIVIANILMRVFDVEWGT